MKRKPITFIPWPENEIKISDYVKETGDTQTNFLNQAIANIPIIGIAESKEIAAGFMRLRDALASRKLEEQDREEVKKLCQSFALLTAKIATFRN